MSEKKKIFSWNHISTDMKEDDKLELKTLYKSYHRSFKCYQWKYKKLKRIKLSLEMSSIGLTVTGSIVGAATLNPIVIACVAGPGILIQGYLTKTNLINNVERCKFAYTSYEKILTQIRSFLRGLAYDEIIFLSYVKKLDDIVIDTCPSVDAFYKKYDKKFIE